MLFKNSLTGHRSGIRNANVNIKLCMCTNSCAINANAVFKQSVIDYNEKAGMLGGEAGRRQEMS